MKKISILSMFILFTLSIFSQSFPYDVVLQAVNINGLEGIQSYSVGQDNGKWLIVGGRVDGLHLRQPNASFDLAGHNEQLIVIDPVSQQKWTASLSTLPITLQEQMRSTNAVFIQEGDYLYIFGGYGYSAVAANHITFDKLTAIDVPAVIDAIINNTSIASFFTQISDARFAITGGQI